jgi:hypothetical protein
MKIKTTHRAWFILPFAGALLTAGAGCVTFDSKTGSAAKPGTGVVHQIHPMWEARIVTTSDTVNQGAPLMGLAGRVYLYGADMSTSLRGQGRITVDLFDPQQPGTDGQPKLLQRWDLDRASLNQLFRKDIIGWGYTLFLPWPDYQPKTTRVQVQVCYTPEKGTPVFASRSEFTLRNDPPRLSVQGNNPPVLAGAPPRN